MKGTTGFGALVAGNPWIGALGATGAAFVAAGLAGYLSAGWGFALLFLAALALSAGCGLFALLALSRAGDTTTLVSGSRFLLAAGAGLYVVAVCALAGYYVRESVEGRMQFYWMVFGPAVLWALVAFDRGIYRKLVKNNLATWQRFRSYVKREDADPNALRRTLLDDVIVQRSLWRQSRFRWIRHTLIFWGFAGMFLAELVVVLMREGFPAFGWHDVWREPGHPVRLAFDFIYDLTGVMILVGCVMALAWRVAVNGRPEQKYSDSPMVIFLLFVVTSGFAVEGWRIGQNPMDPVHSMSFVGVGVGHVMAALGLTGAGAFQPLWLVHAVASCALIAFLPATRLVHTCATPIGRLMNSQTGLLAAKRKGVLGAMLLGRERAASRIADANVVNSNR